MNTTLIGFLASLMAGIFFGLYPVPRRYVQFGINDFMISMTLGVFLTGLISIFTGISSFAGFGLNQWLIGILAGGCWCLGTILYVYAVDCMGVGRATPIKNLTAILGIMFGLIIFQEYKDLNLLKGIFLAAGTGCLITTGMLLGGIQGQGDISRPSCPVNLVVPDFIKQTPSAAGWILALGAALMYAVFSIPTRILSTTADNVFQFLPAVGIGALLTSIILDMLLTSDHTWLNNSLKEHLLAILSGGLWSVAFIGLATGLKHLGVSISWPLANSSTIFSVLYAVFIAREISFSSNKSQIIKGLLVGIMGITLLGLSM